MTSQIDSQLIHGIYNPVQKLMVAADAKLRSLGFNPEEFEWIGDPEPPSFDDANENIVVCLYDTLDSLDETVEFLWVWMIQGQKDGWCGPYLTEPGYLRDFRDPENSGWQPRTRRWVKINLSANCNKSSKWTRQNIEHGQIAGLEIMAAMAQHPHAMAARDGVNKPWPNLAALDFNDPHDMQPWHYVPCVEFHADLDQVRFSAAWVTNKSFEWSCPIVLSE